MSKTKAAAPKQPKLTSAEGVPISEATPLGAGMFELANRFVVAVEQLTEEVGLAKLMLMNLSEQTILHQQEVLKLGEKTYRLTARVSGQFDKVAGDPPHEFEEVTPDRADGEPAEYIARGVLADVTEERNELSERLGRLRGFIGTPLFGQRSMFEQNRLKQQIPAMANYLRVLNDRIAGLQRELGVQVDPGRAGQLIGLGPMM